MTHTWEKVKRKEQQVVLRAKYAEYDPKHHDVFVKQYNEDAEKAALEAYHHARGL